MALAPIDGHTRMFAVLGHPVGHTLSPPMHNAALEALGMNARYVAFDVEPEHLEQVLRAMQRMGFQGANLTIPLKEVAYRVVDELAPSAAPLGSVNTIEFCDGGALRGHSTDGDGLLDALQADFQCGVDGRNVCILGPGGAGRAVAIACARAGARSLHIAGRRSETVQRVARESRDAGCEDVAEYAVPMEQWDQAATHADIIIQCTPIGMKPADPPVLPARAFHEGQVLCDLIYRPETTPTMMQAQQGGARATNGLAMLLHQGARSLAIWTGASVPTDAMGTALKHVVYGT